MEINKEFKEYFVKLNSYEALVLFEWLVKFNEHHKLPDEAEQKILYNFESILESVLVEPFLENYVELINTAKNHIIND
ncbi:hypothetical protein [Neisseria sp. 83E34]|uniref:hypothetical protein n=1 Tax=Neisseria sp. 83E34 TaxID=1692264 RepID=UPI0006CE8E35|nr:hypothetical protein [Neisseria sp. 83E34]KPN70578.1 hypothetical protein AKG09_11420 [Neisseria sp. 83E34]